MYRQSSFASSSSSSSACATSTSSPVFGPVDSSPPSSPGLVPYALANSPPRSPISKLSSDPFAASTKAIKRHPNYEKKSDSPPCTPPGTFTRSALNRLAPNSRSLHEDGYASNGSPNASPLSHRTTRYIDREERIWDAALREPFDTGIGQIDLSNQQLESIPPSIGDLVGFFNTPESSEQSLLPGRTLMRVNTEPAVDSARTRSFGRTQSIMDSGKERHVLKLYLMSNLITSLPLELFSVTNLTVLSLRGNRLTSMPPDICRLTNLHELNIANNRLTFLPWQMRDMKIDKLLVHPNPFLEPAHDSHPTLAPRRSLSRLHSLRTQALSRPTKPVLSPVTLTLARVPPLTELCLRLLLAPSETTPSHSVMVDYYGLPLSDQWSIPPTLRLVLTSAIPGICKRLSVDTRPSAGAGAGAGEPDREGEQVGSRVSGVAACPSPAHRGRVFIKHASERFSWETRIAGVDVGGVVPLQWRGCMTTCLDFLDEVQGGGPEESPSPSAGEGDADVDDDVDMAEAVQVVDLAAISFDMDEFEFDV